MLIPVHCWRTAKATAMRRVLRTPDRRRSLQPECSPSSRARAFPILRTSLSAYGVPPIRWRMSRAFSSGQQPTWTLRNEARREREDDRGDYDSGEHPAPSVLHVPGLEEKRGGYMIWNRPSDSPIDDLSQQNTDDDRELIQADKPTSDR